MHKHIRKRDRNTDTGREKDREISQNDYLQMRGRRILWGVNSNQPVPSETMTRHSYLFLPILSALLFTSCDTTNLANTDNDPVIAARNWFESNTSQSEIIAKYNGGGINPDKLLAQFPPDWATSDVIKVPQHKDVVVVLLGRNARKSFGRTNNIVRTLIVTMNNDGSVAFGEIVEFAGHKPGATDNVRQLVRSIIEEDFKNENITVGRYDALYQPIGAMHYSPDYEPIPLSIRLKRCTEAELSGGASKSAAETYDCYVSDMWEVCAGPLGDEPESCTEYITYTCEEIGDGDGDSGGGGGSTGGGGGGGGAVTEPPTNAPDGVPQDYYDSLNRAEKLQCITHPSACVAMGLSHGHFESWAGNLAVAAGAGSAFQNVYDAMRHAAWMAYAGAYSQDIAGVAALGAAHESELINGQLDADMDLHNNDVGLGIAMQYPYGLPYSTVESLVIQAAQNGELRCIVVNGQPHPFLVTCPAP